jgi:uncharacterized repeat protein (TIGR02543 family)
MAKKSFVLLALALCLTACEDFNRPLGPWIDEQYDLMKKVWDVSVSPHSVAVAPGASRQFAARLSVRADADQSVTWRVSGAAYPVPFGTTGISAGGLLSVDASEPPGTLTVTATSVFDRSKSASAQVSVGTGGAAVTVTFNENGGNWPGASSPAPLTVNQGDSVNEPTTSPFRAGYTFAGWSLTQGGAAVLFPYTVTANTTLYARWTATTAAVTNATGWNTAIQAFNTAGAGSYVIDIGTNSFSLPGSGGANNPNINSGVSITITGSGTITLSGAGPFFRLGSGATLTLNGAALYGNPSSNGAVVHVDNGGAFIMNSGTITGNTTYYGGGVYVDNGGQFTMTGGAIISNTATGGGGVYVMAGGTFTLDSPAAPSDVNSNTPNQVQNAGGTINGTAGITAGW